MSSKLLDAYPCLRKSRVHRMVSARNHTGVVTLGVHWKDITTSFTPGCDGSCIVYEFGPVIPAREVNLFMTSCSGCRDRRVQRTPCHLDV